MRFQEYGKLFTSRQTELQSKWDGHSNASTLQNTPSKFWTKTQQWYYLTHTASAQELKILQRWNREDACQWHYWAGTNRMGSPIMFIRKKDGTIKFCANYRKLDVATTQDRYFTSRKKKCTDSLSKAAVFSTQGANSVYWRFDTEDSDKIKKVANIATGIIPIQKIALQTLHCA